MKKSVQDALEAAATRLGALDPEVIRLPEFVSVRKMVRIIDGQPDPVSVSAAVSEMRKLKPRLFVDFATMDAAAFDSAEKLLRQGVAAPTAPPAVPRDLDASRLSDRELRELDEAVRGRTNSYDAGVLAKAYVRQRQEDAALNGNG